MTIKELYELSRSYCRENDDIYLLSNDETQSFPLEEMDIEWHPYYNKIFIKSN